MQLGFADATWAKEQVVEPLALLCRLFWARVTVIAKKQVLLGLRSRKITYFRQSTLSLDLQLVFGQFNFLTGYQILFTFKMTKGLHYPCVFGCLSSFVIELRIITKYVSCFRGYLQCPFKYSLNISKRKNLYVV